VKQFNPEINTILLTGYSSNMPEEVALLNNDIDAYATKDSKLDYLFKTIKFIAKFIAKNRNKNIDYLLYNLTFEERLKKLRKIKGVTQEELSNFLGVGKSSVVGYENGSIRPSFNQLINIIKFYGIDPNTLFGSLEQYNK
jgi:DNA-binding XRE family transcriptional regulator